MSEREQFLVSASMRPTLMADPLDGQETEMTDGFRFIRKHIEFFAAGAADVENRRKKGGKKSEIRVGQIGARCVHCAHVPPKARANGAVAFPTNLSLVYQSVRNWQSKLSSEEGNQWLPLHMRVRYDGPIAESTEDEWSRHTEPFIICFAS